MAKTGTLVHVSGFRELQRLFALAPAATRKEVGGLEEEVARPVQASAEGLAGSRIKRITPEWRTMRIGITRKLIYVAPKRRGTRVEKHKRRKFATLMDERAMTPAAERNQPLMNARMERLFEEFARRWNGLG